MELRKQPIYAKTGRIINIVYASLLCVVLCLVLLNGLNVAGATTASVPWSMDFYIKPPIDKTAKYGMPLQTDTQPFAYSNGELGNGIQFGMATSLYRQKNGSITIYLTNPENSGAYLLCEIKDEASGKIIAESGRVANGKFVTSLKPKNAWKNEATPVTVTIYAMDLQDCYSLGSMEFQTTLQPW